MLQFLSFASTKFPTVPTLQFRQRNLILYKKENFWFSRMENIFTKHPSLHIVQTWDFLLEKMSMSHYRNDFEPNFFNIHLYFDIYFYDYKHCCQLVQIHWLQISMYNLQGVDCYSVEYCWQYNKLYIYTRILISIKYYKRYNTINIYVQGVKCRELLVVQYDKYLCTRCKV